MWTGWSRARLQHIPVRVGIGGSLGQVRLLHLLASAETGVGGRPGGTWLDNPLACVWLGLVVSQTGLDPNIITRATVSVGQAGLVFSTCQHIYESQIWRWARPHWPVVHTHEN